MKTTHSQNGKINDKGTANGLARLMSSMALLASTFLFGTSLSFGQDDSKALNHKTLDGARLYKTKLCHTCHGAEGAKPIMPRYPKIAGQNKEYLIEQIKDIKTGKRSNGLSTTMKAMVANLTDEEITAISDYLSKLK